jgi:hypothetical protein
MTAVSSKSGEISQIAPTQRSPSLWKLIFRIVRWSTYALALVTLILILRTPAPPVVETSPQAAARVETKMDDVEQAVLSGQPGTLRMDQTELNSYLASHLGLSQAANAARGGAVADENAPSTASAGTGSAASYAGDASALDGTRQEQVEQARSSVKDVKIELIDDRVRAYVVFDFYGKDMSLQLEGKLGASDGYLHFLPVNGHLGSLPIPQSTLETAVHRMMESPENRERLQLPADISDLRVENGEVIATYR